MCSPSPRPTRVLAAWLPLLIAVAMVSVSCRAVLSPTYEYEEDVFLRLDGSATVYVNASIPALVALRDANLDPDPRARFDRERVRRVFESPVARVVSVSGSRRDNRRYVHVRLEVPDVRRLSEAPIFAWSRYELTPHDEWLAYRQHVGGSPALTANAGWTGAELTAVRLHLPSRVPFHNSPSRTVERGNIIRWEQPLAQRLEGRPLEIEVHMETESILVRTLALFGTMIGLAGATFAAAIWWVGRRGRAPIAAARPQSPPTAA